MSKANRVVSGAAHVELCRQAACSRSVGTTVRGRGALKNTEKVVHGEHEAPRCTSPELGQRLPCKLCRECRRRRALSLQCQLL